MVQRLQGASPCRTAEGSRGARVTDAAATAALNSRIGDLERFSPADRLRLSADLIDAMDVERAALIADMVAKELMRALAARQLAERRGNA